MPVKKNKKTEERKREILGVLLMVFALLIFFGIISYRPEDFPNAGSPENVKNWLGLAGAWMSHYLYVYTIGYSCGVLPLLVFMLGWTVFAKQSFRSFSRLSLYLVLLGLFLSTAMAMPEALSENGHPFSFKYSGLLGGFFARHLSLFLGPVGSIGVLLTFLLIFLITATSWSMRHSVMTMREGLLSLAKNIKFSKPAFRQAPKTPKIRIPAKQGENEKEESDSGRMNEKGPIPISIPKEDPFFNKEQQVKKEKPEIQNQEEKILSAVKTENEGEYVLPPLDLLHPQPAGVAHINRQELEQKAYFLLDRLKEFDIRGEIVGIRPGPIITRYEVRPAPGIKISRFVGCQDDLALVMQAHHVRVAPIPGKAAVGVEIPNPEPQTVFLRSVLGSDVFRKAGSKLTLALGQTTEGKPYTANLAEMPHLLVAGATGSGKSVCLNTILASILFRAKPDEIKLVLVDPKKLELSLYRVLKNHHLATREGLNEDVITTVDNAVSMLRSLEGEMDRRYRILAKAGVRDLSGYHQYVKHRAASAQNSEDIPENLPYIVLVVDELADLMITGAREVEEPIARLAQMSRAVGIHLILATQRPSVDVITGVIKANFPCRIAFQVTSKTDSRTILDRNGAEKLLGRGDMLFMNPRQPDPVRIHGAFVSTDEVKRLVAYIAHQPKSERLKLRSSSSVSGTARRGGGLTGDRDELFTEAAKLVIRHQQGSASLLQRRLRVGYARAGRLIDELEELGIIGPYDGSKAREVLVDEEFLDRLPDLLNASGDEEDI